MFNTNISRTSKYAAPDLLSLKLFLRPHLYVGATTLIMITPTVRKIKSDSHPQKKT